MIFSLQRVADQVTAEVGQAGADAGMLHNTMEMIMRFSETQLGFAVEIPRVDAGLFAETGSETPRVAGR